MIQDIQFPEDPENYVFSLKSRFAATYLLARAKQHYGTLEGLDIVCNNDFNTLESFTERKAQYVEMCRLAGVIGIPHLKFLWWDKMFPDTFRLANGQPDKLAVTAAMLKLIQQVDPTAEGVADGGYLGSGQAMKAMSLLRYANQVDENLELNHSILTDGTKWKTIVRWNALHTKPSKTDPFRDTIVKCLEFHQQEGQQHDPNQPRPLEWAPLIGYTLADIISEADKHGVLDVVLETNVCEGHWKFGRPGHCGVCRHCLIRRHAAIQAQVTDTTKYDLT